MIRVLKYYIYLFSIFVHYISSIKEMMENKDIDEDTMENKDENNEFIMVKEDIKNMNISEKTVFFPISEKTVFFPISDENENDKKCVKCENDIMLDYEEESKVQKKELSIQQFIYKYHVEGDCESKYNSAICNDLSKYNWLEQFSNGSPRFFMKAIIGDVESLLKIFDTCNENLLCFYNKYGDNVLNYLAKNNNNNELLKFVDCFKNKYDPKIIFENCKNIDVLIMDFIKSGNSRVFDLYIYLENEDILKFQKFIRYISQIPDEELVKFAKHKSTSYEIKRNNCLLIELKKEKTLEFLNAKR